MTFGYIFEGDIERFLAATWPVSGPTEPLPERFKCPFCVQVFATSEQRNLHLSDNHSGERPVLLLSGTEPASRERIRHRFSGREITFLNCTSVLIQHAGWEPEELDVEAASRTLSGWKGRARVQLVNRFEHAAAPILQAYDLQFEAYEKTALARADLAFVEWCGQADPTMGDVDNFLLTEAAQSVSSYSSALAGYVVGVLLKDRPSHWPGESISYYRAKLNGSLRELQEFDRPLANLISCLIRLSSNDVARPFRPSEGALLNTTLNVLGKLSEGEIPDFAPIPVRSQKGKVICPIDNGTSRVLERTKWLSVISRFSEDVVDQFKAELDIASIDPLDKVKLAALWAGRALGLGLQTEAILPLRVLVGDAIFGHWAEQTLEKIDG